MSGKSVAVIGAGVAGLTAAHELAERGFRVWVFEGEHDSLHRSNVSIKAAAAGSAFPGVSAYSRPPAVGGLAATQWYRIEHAWSGARGPAPAADEEPRIPRLVLAESVNLAKPGDWWSPEVQDVDLRCLRSEANEARVRFQRNKADILPFAAIRIGRLADRLKEYLEKTDGVCSIDVVTTPFVGESPGIPTQRSREILLELLAACHRRGMEGTLVTGEQSGFTLREFFSKRDSAIQVRSVMATAPIEIPDGQNQQRHVSIRAISSNGPMLADADWQPPPVPEKLERALAPWEGRWPLLPFAADEHALSPFVKWRIEQVAERLAKRLRDGTEDEYLVIGGVVEPSERPSEGKEGAARTKADPFTDPTGLAHARAVAVAEALILACVQGQGLVKAQGVGETTFLLKHGAGPNSIHVRVAGLGALHATEAARPPATQCYVEVRLLDRLLPGEHGYRFFPSFYHHTFETMKRIPLLAPGKADTFMIGYALNRMRSDESVGFSERWEPTAQTVFDNLCSVDLHAVDSGVTGSGRPMERYNTRSLRSLLKMLDTFQETSDVPVRDIVLGQLKILRYATSCSARRDSYESQTWTDFTEARLGGDEYRKLLDHWPQALVGLQASRADARTTGTILLQLLLDQVRSSGYRDGTLNAPTSEAWLDPWKRYLEQERGVSFVCAKIDRFRFKEIEGKRYVHIAGVGCDGATVIDRGTLSQSFDYVVIATSVDVTARLGRLLRASLTLEGSLPSDFEVSPFARVAGLMPDGDAYQTTADSVDPFEHFSGIQFYLDTDYAPLRGHVYYSKSPWRLSSVSQSQFRLDRPGQLDGYTGVISVVIGAFDERGYNNLTAWECTADQLALEVWAQITKSLQADTEVLPRLPRYYAIDKNLEFKGAGGTLSRNRTPFLVNSADRAGAFSERPGDYRVYMGHFVFAGTYLQTRTRLVTMEAANESARHAVNAVIRHGRQTANTGQLCAIYDPEEREPDELQVFHRIDAELQARGLPHWMDILAVETGVRAALDRTDGSSDQSLAAALMTALESASGIGGELMRLIRTLLLR